MESQTHVPSTDSSAITAEGTATLGATLLRVAWLAVGLGLVLEVLLILLAIGFSGTLGMGKIVADLVQKISWSVIVCVGLAFGKAASNGKAAWMGLSGLFATPVAFGIARTLHKTAASALKLAEQSYGAAFPFVIVALKGIEYAVLGLVLAWLGKKATAGAMSYTGTGLVVGLVFATAIVYSSGAQHMTPDVISQFVNEVVFPIGCSLAIFGADVLGKRMK
jgi:hypothetical protein